MAAEQIAAKGDRADTEHGKGIGKVGNKTKSAVMHMSHQFIAR